MGVQKRSSIFWSSSACVLLILIAFVDVGVGQNCGCNGLCCSQWGYCGSGDAYCGTGCKEGPCSSSSSSPPSTSTGGGGGGVDSIVSLDVFNSLVGGASSDCAGNGFYTNYDSFINAANAFTGFGTSGSSDVNKREVAAFFANAAHETGGFCHIDEQDPPQNYCNSSYTQYPCNSDKSYHGRGPLQLSWNYNYGAAGNELQFDGLNNPETVATDSGISFKTAVWFWMKNSQCHTAITSGQGFGGTIRAINSQECDGGDAGKVSSRVNYFQKFCQQLNVDPGSNLQC